MSPKQYLEEIVIPTVDEYRADNGSRRKCYLACVATHHLYDHVGIARGRKLPFSENKVAVDAFNLVRAVATGAKHVGNDEQKNPIRFAAGSELYRPPARAGVMVCGWSELGDVDGGLVVEASPGKWMSVSDAIGNLVYAYVMAFRSTHFSDFDFNKLRSVCSWVFDGA